MTGADARGYTFTSMWLKYVLPGAIFMAVWLGFVVNGLITERAPILWIFVAVGGVMIAVFAWVVVRKLVRSASFDGRRLRAATLLSRHEIDLAEVTDVSWNSAGSGALGSMLPFAGATARVRHRGGELMVPMPDGTDLLQRLEEAGAPSGRAKAGAAGHRDGVQDFDLGRAALVLQLFIAALPLPWLIGMIVTTVNGQSPPPVGWLMVGAAIVAAGCGLLFARTRLIRRAVIDGDHLRATTANGRDHDFALSDLEVPEAGVLTRMNNGVTPLHHPGGKLWVPRPAGSELVDRLHAAGVDR
jgi:hypothetical protein